MSLFGPKTKKDTEGFFSQYGIVLILGIIVLGALIFAIISFKEFHPLQILPDTIYDTGTDNT